MGLIDGVKDIFKGLTYEISKQTQTDVECPKCHHAKLIRTIEVIGVDSDLVCPNCGYSLNNSLGTNGGNPPCPPSPQTIEI